MVKSIESKTAMVVARGWRGEGTGELLIQEHQLSVMQDEYAMEICCTLYLQSMVLYCTL